MAQQQGLQLRPPSPTGSISSAACPHATPGPSSVAATSAVHPRAVDVDGPSSAGAPASSRAARISSSAAEALFFLPLPSPGGSAEPASTSAEGILPHETATLPVQLPTPTFIIPPISSPLPPISSPLPPISSPLPPITSPLPPPSPPAALFEFRPMLVAENCVPTDIAWTYAGPPVQVQILIAPSEYLNVPPDDDDDDAPAPAPAFAPVRALPPVDATLQTHAWTPVNYSAGWYTLKATPTQEGEGDGDGDGGPDGPRYVFLQSSPFPITLNNAGADCDPAAPPPSQSVQPAPAPTGSGSGSGPSDGQTLPAQKASDADAHGAGNMRAEVVAGGIIAGVVVLITFTVAFLCFGGCGGVPCRRGRGRGRGRRTRPPALDKKKPYQSTIWAGLASSETSLRTVPGTTYSPAEHKPPRTPELPRAALPRLEPNRRQPSLPLPLPVTPSALARSPVAAPPPPPPRTQARSPARAPSAYRTRKPTPSLDLLEELSGGSGGGGGGGSPGGRSFDATSPVPSSATSKMYRTRDSGASYHTQAPSRMSCGTQAPSEETTWRARASSVIDPHLFGAVKTMHAVVPSMPPLPARRDGQDR
ncbi:hypothetical protein BC628DRAFT_1419647 [Trametes gibbosa]|nr:hypothetical protein BC628DRAFT_1419647 [Trametes gibbosa]